MANRSFETSPQFYARIGGVLYLIIIIFGGFDEAFVRSKLIVANDPVTTAHNIMASEQLFRFSTAADLIMHVCDIPLILIFYLLLKPVSKSLSLLGAFFNLVQTAILGINKLNLLAVLFLLGGAAYLKAFEPNQLQVLAYLSLKLHDHGFSIGLVFFGFRCLVVGLLIFKSGYIPKILGILQIIAGFCYIFNSFALYITPAFANKLFPAIVLPAGLAELAMCIYLLVQGVNIQKWQERVRLSAY